jgi:hypothetical protein
VAFCGYIQSVDAILKCLFLSLLMKTKKNVIASKKRRNIGIIQEKII